MRGRRDGVRVERGREGRREGRRERKGGTRLGESRTR